MSRLRILSPGIRASFQDLGRQSFKFQGVPVGGAYDGFSYRWANHLLANPANCATIEIDVGLAKLEALEPVTIAVTGAHGVLKVNGINKAMWTRLTLNAGDVLSLSAARQGARYYLAIEGGFKAPLTLDSASTDANLGIGGLDGKGSPLDKGDVAESQQHPTKSSVVFEDSLANPASVSSRVIDDFLPNQTRIETLNVVPCYQAHQFSNRALEVFSNSTFTVSQRCSRMGVTLEGNQITAPSAGVISEGIVPGAIQIMPDGSPTLLGCDAQTIGGYPKLGVLPQYERWKLGQLAQGQQIQFCFSDWETETKKSAAWRRFFGY